MNLRVDTPFLLIVHPLGKTGLTSDTNTNSMLVILLDDVYKINVKSYKLMDQIVSNFLIQ